MKGICLVQSIYDFLEIERLYNGCSFLLLVNPFPLAIISIFL